MFYDLFAVMLIKEVYDRTKIAYQHLQEGRLNAAFLVMGCDRKITPEEREDYNESVRKMGTVLSEKAEFEALAYKEYKIIEPKTREFMVVPDLECENNGSKCMGMSIVECKNCGSVEIKKHGGNTYLCKYCGTYYYRL